jgi:hypothetical protein
MRKESRQEWQQEKANAPELVFFTSLDRNDLRDSAKKVFKTGEHDKTKARHGAQNGLKQ